MSWTIACFCGNIYTTPPDRCAVCGSTVEDAAPRPNASATDEDALAPRTSPTPIARA
jgi:rRNA maturation endonuclease Nob1